LVLEGQESLPVERLSTFVKYGDTSNGMVGELL
jgi:hypothetical protein